MEAHKKTILIVDDNEMNRAMLVGILEDEYDLMEAQNGLEAVTAMRQSGHLIDLVLLDIVMPDMDGFDVLAVMNKQHWIQNLPVIMITAESAPSCMERAFELGVSDFITRPFDTFIVRQRIKNTLALYGRQRQLLTLATDQLYEKERNTNMMVNILSYIVEFRNGESGLHVLHVQKMTEILLHHLVTMTDKYPLTSQEISRIATASALHDIGKIAIDEKILNKPGKLTDEEYKIMKTHSAIGADMLGRLTVFKDEPLVKTAYEICRWHHERYDGRGYPDGLKGEEIPISAQAVAMADVYDALISDRCYHKARSHEETLKMIRNNECGVFNPLLIQCLIASSDDIQEELSIVSPSTRTERELKKFTDELMEHEELSASEQVFQMLSLERQRTHFFSSINRVIQFDFTVDPALVTFNQEGIHQIGLTTSSFNPYESKVLHQVISGEDLRKIFDLVHATTPEQPDTSYTCNLKLGNASEQEYLLRFRSMWSTGDEHKFLGFAGQVMRPGTDSTEIN